MITMDKDMEKYLKRTSYDFIKKNINEEIRNKNRKRNFYIW